MVYRFKKTYDEILDILALKYIPKKWTGHSLNPGIYEVVDLNNTFKFILTKKKVSVTIHDLRLKSNLKIIQTSIFTKKSFLDTILGFTRSGSYPLDDIDGFYQLIAVSYKSDRPVNLKGTDKIRLKCDCINGSLVNGVWENTSYSLALSSPAGPKIYKEPRIKLFKKVNKSVLSQITFYLEDDDHKPVDFHNKTINFICQLIKIQQTFEYN